jgi:hypothetical protein
VLEDDEPVTCSSCGTFVLTYSELKRRSEKSERVPVSGC